MNTAHRAFLEPNTTSVKKLPAFLYTVWTSQQIFAEPEKVPILLDKANPVRFWKVPQRSGRLWFLEFQ